MVGAVDAVECAEIGTAFDGTLVHGQVVAAVVAWKVDDSVFGGGFGGCHGRCSGGGLVTATGSVGCAGESVVGGAGRRSWRAGVHAFGDIAADTVGAE